MENSEIGLTCKKRQNEITYWWIFFVFDKSGIYCDLSLYSRTVKKGTIKYTCFHFLPYLLQPDTFTRSVLMWKKENLFAFMGKAYYFRYSAFAMVNTYFLAQWEQRFSNVSFVSLLTNQTKSRENRGEWFGMRYLLSASPRLWIPPAKFDIFKDEKKTD